MNGNPKYCLITPCRNEAKFARRTLRSVTSQTIAPALWLIVDDGSTDDTAAILAEYAEKFPYIRILHREDRGFRKLGAGVIEAFYQGYDSIDPNDFDFICKLDLDLDLPPGYFEALMNRMEASPQLGTASGKPYFIDQKTGRKVMETCGDENSVGMVKFYRRECFVQIGGFVKGLMWDGIDCHKCRNVGMDRGLLERCGSEFRAFAADGDERQKLVDGPGASRCRTIFHGNRRMLYRCEHDLPLVSTAGRSRFRGNPLGIF